MLVTLRSIGDGVITTDESGRVQIINHIAEGLTGWKQYEAVGRPLEEVFHVIHEEDRTRHENPYVKVMETGNIVELKSNTLLIAKDGTERVIVDSSSPIRYENGEIIGAVVVFRDQTEARKIQERMQRTDKLESLGVLTSGLAHDFNNLLGGVFGYVELAQACSTEDEVKSYLSEASDVFERARGITHQLLNFSQGGKPVQKAFRIDELVKKDTSFILSGTNIAVEYHIPDDVSLCWRSRLSISINP